MSEEERFDAIIVGAGPAGAACAYTLAREGRSVLVIERGDSPGAKNLTGGRLYTYALEAVAPGLSSEAALERKVTHEQIMVLGNERAISIDYHDPAFNQGGKPAHSYTLLRAKFDEWFAGQAEAMGAMVACGVKVDGLMEQNGQILGVVAGEDEMPASVVVAADGVNSLLAQKAGLFPDIAASSVGVGVKEIIELPARTIEERFHLQQDEGAARMILGCTAGLHGGGFLYTNEDSISLGCVFMPEELARQGRSVHELFQELKMHPAVYPLLAGGETVEYGAHLVSENGCRGIPKRLYRDGLLVAGDAAGFVVNTGTSIRGIDLAILSGIAAARAIIQEENPARIGPAYRQELDKIRLLPTMRALDGYKDMLDIPRIYRNYPMLAVDLAQKVFTVDGQVPPGLKKELKALLKKNQLSWWQMFKDGLRGYKSV